jgi:hypothetical protein
MVLIKISTAELVTGNTSDPRDTVMVRELDVFRVTNLSSTGINIWSISPI